MNILHRLRAENVSAASATLPSCATASETFVTATAEVPNLGRVIFLFKRFHHKHGKSSHWFWAVQNAIREEDLSLFDGKASRPHTVAE